MSADPQEDFEAAWRASSAETVAQGLVVAALGLPLLAVVEVVQLARRAAARMRRWPMPANLGCLTNEDIDRLPERPAPSVKREDVERVIADAKLRRN